MKNTVILAVSMFLLGSSVAFAGNAPSTASKATVTANTKCSKEVLACLSGCVTDECQANCKRKTPECRVSK